MTSNTGQGLQLAITPGRRQVPITRYRYAARRFPIPGSWLTTPEGRYRGAGCVETRTAGSAIGLEKRTDGDIDTAPQADSTRVVGYSGLPNSVNAS